MPKLQPLFVSAVKWPRTIAVGGYEFLMRSKPTFVEGSWYQERDADDNPIGDPEWIPPTWFVQFLRSECPYHPEHGLYLNLSWPPDQDLQPTTEAALAFRDAKLALAEMSLADILERHAN